MEMSLFLKQITAVKPTKAQMNIKTICHAKTIKIPNKIKNKNNFFTYFLFLDLFVFFVTYYLYKFRKKNPQKARE